MGAKPLRINLNTERDFLRFLLFSVVPLSIIGQLSTEIYLPSLPHMANFFGVDIHIIQLTIAIYLCGFAIGGLIYGVLSDIYGRVPIILISLGVGGLGSLICVCSFDIHVLFVGRLIQGLGYSGMAVVCRSMCRDVANDSAHLSKIGSILGMSGAVAIAFAPIIGGYIQAYLFWRMSFVFLLSVNLVLLYTTWRKLPETNKNIGSVKLNQVFTLYCKILSNKEFLRYNIVSASTLGGVIAYQTISSNLLQLQVGLTPEKFGLTSLLTTLSLLVGGYFNSILVSRRGFHKMMKVGFCFLLASGCLYSIFGLFGYISVFSVMSSAVCYMVGASIVYPNASTGSMSLYPNSAGAAASIYNCLQMLGGALGSSLVSLSHHASQLNLAVLYIGITAICFLLSKNNKNLINEIRG